MAISFNQIPADLRTPLFYAEVDNTRAGGGSQPLRAVIIGQQTRNVAETLQLVQDEVQAANRFGPGSMIARQVSAFRRNNPWTELWVVPLKDDSGGTAAAGTLTLTGTTTAAGTIYLYIAGERIAIPIPMLPGGTSAASAAAMVRSYIVKQRASVDVLNNLPVNITVSSNVLTFTAKNKGTVGNAIDLRANYAGPQSGEDWPDGLTGAFLSPPMQGGTADPDVATALTKIGDEPFEYWISAYNDTTSIGKISAVLADRWGPLKQLYGHAFVAKDATYSTLVTIGDGLNDPHLTYIGYNDAPTWAPEYAAAFGAQAAINLSRDPARTLQTLPLVGVLPPTLPKQWTIPEANILLQHGIATTMQIGGMVRIQRAITTYQVNALGADDNSYLDVTTLSTLARLIRDMRNLVLTRFPRHKLAKDGTAFGAGQAIVTPSVVRAELLGLYRRWVRSGLTQNVDRFDDLMIVELDDADPNRLNVRVAPTLINNLIVFASQIQFRLKA